MAMQMMNHAESDSNEVRIPLKIAVPVIAAAAVAPFVLIWILQPWLAAIAQSLAGAQPMAYWDLARMAGIVGYLLMWASVMFGLIITNRMARVWPGGPTAFDLHQFTALLGLAFAVFHGLILLGDQYIHYTLLQILVPFASAGYKPLWVGLGQLAFYALIPISFSFYFRKRIGANLWRGLHYGTFIAFSLVTIHGLLAGTDSSGWLMLATYAATGASVIWMTVRRIRGLVGSAA